MHKRRWGGRWEDAWGEVRALFTDNIGYKLLSLLFATFLWVWVQSEQVVNARLPVEIRWVLPEGMIPLEPLLTQGMVEVEGVQAVVRGAQNRELVVEVDLSGARVGEATVDMSERPIQGLPPQLRTRGLTPGSLRIQLDRASRRNLPVRIKRAGEVEAGFAVRDVQIKPEVVEVIGPASVLRGMEEIQTEAVELSGLREDLEVQVPLDLRRGLSAKQRGVTVTVDVEAERGSRLFDMVPVQVVGDGRWVAGLETVGVILEGPTEVLSRLEARALKLRVVIPPETHLEAHGGAIEVGPGSSGLHYVVEHAGGALVTVQRVEPDRIPIQLPAEKPPEGSGGRGPEAPETP